ncbi:hypothetical protein ACWCQQ_33695 [Streptomyces sp. NPDC002143]
MTYYALIRDGYPRENPSGVVRRRVSDGVESEEVFTRNLRWEPSDYLLKYSIGHNDVEHIEISEEEVMAFIDRVTEKFSR